MNPRLFPRYESGLLVHGTGSGVPSALDMTKHIGTRRAEIQLLAAFVCQPIAGGTEQ